MIVIILQNGMLSN